MKKILAVAVIGTIIMTGVVTSNAQTTNTNPPVVISGSTQILTVALQGFMGGAGTNVSGATSVKIATKDILKLLGDALGTTFPSNSKLEAITDTNGNFFVVVAVPSGKTVTLTDVTPFFTITTVAGPIVKSSGKGGQEFSIDDFLFGGGGNTNVVATATTFEVQGFTQTSIANGAFTSTVNGPASVSGTPAVLKGTIKASATKQSKK